MKIESKTITDFLHSIDYMVEQIYETVHSGDDGHIQCVRDQIDEIQQKIKDFEQIELSVITPKKENVPGYVKKWENMAENEMDPMEYTQGDRINSYKAHLYLYCKKHMQTIPAEKIAELPAESISMFIEDECLQNGGNARYLKMAYSNEYFHSSQAVFQDIADQIIEERKRAPQQKLF